MTTHNLIKGVRVHARWLQATAACLSGTQRKTGAVQREVIGVITHIRGDHPTNPTMVRVWVQPDDGGDEEIVDPRHIIAVL